MFTIFCTISIVLLILVALFQSAYVFAYISRVSSRQNPESQPGSATSFNVAVILCLRGADPDLKECLTALHRQNYPNYEVHLVLDCADDPAGKVVKEFNSSRSERSGPQQFVHILDPVRPQGSLKCQGIVHAIRKLDCGIEVVAMIDADAIVATDWLSRLVDPLCDPIIGASTGNRWFTPVDNRVGSWVRQTWNAAAIVQMQLYRIAWGGSLAMRLDVIESCGLLGLWSKAFCEDTMISSVLGAKGLTVHRVAGLVVDNHESTSLQACTDWIIRQLLTVRLYHKLWPLVFIHAVNVGLAFLIPLVTVLFGALLGQWIWTAIIGTAWLLFQSLNLALIQQITKTNLRLISAASPQGTRSPQVMPRPFTMIYSVLVAQLVQPWAAITAATAKATNWRRIRYRIEKTGVMLDQYLAYHEPEQKVEAKQLGPDRKTRHNESIR